MRSAFWKVFFRHPTNVFVAGILCGAVYFTIGLYTHDPTNRIHVLGQVAPGIEVICLVFFYAVFIAGVVFLLHMRFLAAFCYLVTGSMAYSSAYTLAWLEGDRFVFTSGPHGEIADIYNGHQSQFATYAKVNPLPLLVPLENQCHPPRDCQCWIVLDPGHTSGIERDIGWWHSPNSSILPAYEFPIRFAIVDVRRIDADTYSVLGCNGAWNSWKPV